MVKHSRCHSAIVAEKIVQNHWNGNVDGICLSVAQSCEIGIINSFDNLLAQGSFDIVAFVEQTDGFGVTCLFRLDNMRKLVGRNDQCILALS